MKLVLALTFVVVFVYVEGKIVLPLTRHEGLRNRLIREGKWQPHQQNVVGSRASRPHSKAMAMVELYDYFNDFFSHNIQIGTPPQNFIIRPDTATSDLWVMDKNLCTATQCMGNPSLTSNFNRTLFDSTKSSTFKAIGSNYASDGICYNGSLASDMVTIAGIGSVTQTFGLCFNVDEFMGLHPFDGYLGLAWPALAATGSTPLIQTLITNNMLSQSVFSVYMLNNNNGSITYGRDMAGSITYGGLDSTNCGPNIAYVPLSSKSYWQFTMSQFNFGTFAVSTNQQAIVSTAEAIFIVPDKVLQGIISQINVTYHPIVDGAQYLVPCSQTPSFPALNFTIGGMVYSIPGPGYVDVIPILADTCALRIETPEGFGFGPSWILGAPFHRQYCVHYDVGNSQIGFSMQTPMHIEQ